MRTLLKVAHAVAVYSLNIATVWAEHRHFFSLFYIYFDRSISIHTFFLSLYFELLYDFNYFDWNHYLFLLQNGNTSQVKFDENQLPLTLSYQESEAGLSNFKQVFAFPCTFKLSKINNCVFTFASEFRQNKDLIHQVQGPKGWVYWTSIKIEAQPHYLV